MDLGKDTEYIKSKIALLIYKVSTNKKYEAEYKTRIKSRLEELQEKLYRVDKITIIEACDIIEYCYNEEIIVDDVEKQKIRDIREEYLKMLESKNLNGRNLEENEKIFETIDRENLKTELGKFSDLNELIQELRIANDNVMVYAEMVEGYNRIMHNEKDNAGDRNVINKLGAKKKEYIEKLAVESIKRNIVCGFYMSNTQDGTKNLPTFGIDIVNVGHLRWHLPDMSKALDAISNINYELANGRKVLIFSDLKGKYLRKSNILVKGFQVKRPQIQTKKGKLLKPISNIEFLTTQPYKGEKMTISNEDMVLRSGKTRFTYLGIVVEAEKQYQYKPEYKEDLNKLFKICGFSSKATYILCRAMNYPNDINKIKNDLCNYFEIDYCKLLPHIKKQVKTFFINRYANKDSNIIKFIEAKPRFLEYCKQLEISDAEAFYNECGQEIVEFYNGKGSGPGEARQGKGSGPGDD